MSVGSIIHYMVIDMNETRLKTVAQLGAFLEGTLEVKFQPIRNDVERYGFIAAVLGRFAYCVCPFRPKQPSSHKTPKAATRCRCKCRWATILVVASVCR